MPQKKGGGGGGKQSNQKNNQQNQKKKQNNQQNQKKKQGGNKQQNQQKNNQNQQNQAKKQQQKQQQQEQQQEQQQQPSQPEGGSPAREQGIHPLEFEWTFWYDRSMGHQANFRNRDERNYESNLKAVGHFSTIEDFWRISHHMNKPSELEMKANYHLFKKGIKPMWEDPENAHGGKWTMEIQNNKELLDLFWESLNIGMIGETIEENDDICGAVVSRRKVADKISLWMRNCNDEETIMKIGKKLRELLPADTDLKLTYQMHEDSLRSGQSYANPIRFTA
eukprot:CAMPEP_0201521772 /NCGR_PEP_ID=MMETSP0161_2-20130828/16159_1 /ASSEMBLY_ACC=CAM_ASM_000251 /TAXON_ID=180227 /ORGANISM="Neoparamoeba aestuarina, Strain SoJaBio B1-5/56/2" /LENGTH=278 /DNA_ID=CAMNT_0047920473 /DNA_START=20 /DNA_END=856 /DNA_ORIENTATION=-